MSRLIFAVPLLLLGLALACGGGGDGATQPSESPLVTLVPTPTRRPAGPTEAPPNSPFRLVIREFTAVEDIIWRVNPLDPAAREELARVPHREGYGIKPSLSPDGKLLAYLALPDFAQSVQSSEAEAFVMDLETKESVRIAGGVDMTFAPLWSPDSRWLYFRRLSGPEFLSANIFILRTKIARKEDPSPTPSPTLVRGATPTQADLTPTPTPDPVQVVLNDSIARVLSFAPIGFSDDERSMYFVQLQGGTGSATLVGVYSPATTKYIEEVEKLASDAKKAADAENKRRADEAIANGQPTPDVTVTPVPTPSPESKFVVQLSDQLAFDYELSPDLFNVSYLNQEFSESGEILNRAYVADMIQATTAPLPANGLTGGHHLRPVWYPDSARVTIGLLPSAGGPGLLALVSPDGTQVSYLTQPESGFDEPRSWAPDASWLVVAHSSGSSLANRGEASLVLVSQTGQRVAIITGADNVTEDSVLGWVNIEQSAASPTS